MKLKNVNGSHIFVSVGQNDPHDLTVVAKIIRKLVDIHEEQAGFPKLI